MPPFLRDACWSPARGTGSGPPDWSRHVESSLASNTPVPYKRLRSAVGLSGWNANMRSYRCITATHVNASSQDARFSSPRLASRRSFSSITLVDQRQRIEAARNNETCPRCGRALPEDRVGTGRLADGVFCSLDCQVEFHAEYYEERIRNSRLSEN